MYTMPVKAIKSLLLKEHEGFMTDGTTIKCRWDYGGYLYNLANEAARARITSCNTYEDLASFILDSRRMSLEEWINSL